MQEIKLPKKFRTVCYEIMDGSYESFEKLKDFTEYPHQITAVEAEMAFFDMDYDKAIELVAKIMPYWDEWYYSNVSVEFMTAMAFAARKIGKVDFVKGLIEEEKERLLMEDKEKCENGKHQRFNFCNIMLKYLETGEHPSDKKELNFSVPDTAKSKDELICELKLKDNTTNDKMKLYNILCMKGFPKEALSVYDEIKDESLAEMYHEAAIIRYLFLGEEEKALETIERLATSRLWSVASPTQVLPMSFFKHPMMHKFLTDEKSLERIKKASFIDNGTVKRK